MGGRNEMPKIPKMEPVCVNVPIGEQAQDFQAGNFLNAVDHLFCWFQEQCSDFTDIEAAEALRLYAKKILGELE